MYGEEAQRHGEIWVPSGASVRLWAVAIEVRPSRYGANGRGEYLINGALVDPVTNVAVRSGQSLAGVGIIAGPGPAYDWVSLSDRTVGSSWTNSGAGRFLNVRMSASRTFAGAGIAWELEPRVTGGGGDDGSQCAAERNRRGPNSQVNGYAEDPVNTYTGSFTDTFVDLESPGGVFGLDWYREYDSGGRVGEPKWGASFSSQLRSGPGGSRELVEPSGRVVRFAPDGGGGFQRGADFTGLLTASGTDWLLTYPDGSTDRFASTGEQVERVSWDGQSVTATWTSGRLEMLTSSVGPTLDPEYDGGGRLESVEASDGRLVTYGYDANGFLDEVVLPGPVAWTLENDVEGQVTRIVDPTGRTKVANEYDDWGRVVSQSSHTGATTTFAYTEDPRQVVVTDVATSTATTYSFDEFGRLASVLDSEGNLSTRTFDVFDQLVGVVHRGGGAVGYERNAVGLVEEITQTGQSPTEIVYLSDGSNRVESVTTPTGTTAFAYDPGVRLPKTVTDPMLNTTTFGITGGVVTSVTDADGVTVLYRYDGLRNLEEVEDEAGNITSYEYDAAGRMTATVAPSGARTQVDYDDAGRPEIVLDPGGGTTTTVYDDADRVLSVTDPAGAVTTYTYDPVTGLPATKTDPLARVTTYTHDAIGQLVRTTFADTSFAETDYGDLGRATAERDELGRETTFDYDADGNLEETVDPEGGIVETVYDAAGRPEWTEDPADRRTTYAYDPVTGLLASETSPAGTISYDYDALGRRQRATDLRGGETETSYTPGGRVEWTEDPLNRRTTYAYDNAGRLATVTAPGNLTTTYGYNADSLVNLVRSPEGNETTTTYDGMGRVLTVTDPAGVVTTNTWTLRGELKTRSTSGAGEAEFSYFPDGTLEWVDDALDNRTTFTYDVRGRLETRVDPNGKVWTEDYNPAGELVSATDPLSRTASYTYDDAGRLLTTADASGRTVSNDWNPDGRLAGRSATDGVNTQTAGFTYDHRGYRESATVDGRTWWYSYSDAGDLWRIEHPDYRDLWFDYDAAGNRTRLTRPDGTSYYYNYDAAGRLDSLRPVYEFVDNFVGWNGPLDSNKWTVSAATGGNVDLADHSGVLEVPATPSETSSIEAKLAAQMDASSTFLYRFASDATPATMRVYERYQSADDHYRLEITSNSSTARIIRAVAGVDTEIATFTVPVDTNAHNVRFEINGDQVCAVVWDFGAGQPAWNSCATDTAVTGAGVPRVDITGASGGANSITIDNFSHWDPAASVDPAVDYTWDDDGNLAGEALAGGGNRAWTWTDGQLRELTQTGIPGANHTTQLAYDAAGRIATETKAGVTTTYGYDAASQLLSATPSIGAASSWEYDDLGRRNKETVGADWTDFTYDDAGQLTTSTPSSGPATTHAYDGAGRRTTDTTGADVTSYSYNPNGQLAALNLPGGEAQLRAYNPDDALDTIVNADGGVTDTYQLDWDTSTGIAELVSFNLQTLSGGTTTNASSATVRGPGAPWAASQEGSTLVDLAVDIHGSPITSTANTLAQDDEYNVWGEPGRAPTLPVKLGYRGELATNDLLHLRARDYQPAVGQFTAADPLDGVNGTSVRNSPYHYTNNNPLNLVDPTGMRPDDCDASFSPFLCQVDRWAKANHHNINGFAIGFAVTAACTAVTAGAGVVACAALGGAVGGGYTSSKYNCGGTNSVGHCASSVARDAAISAVLSGGLAKGAQLAAPRLGTLVGGGGVIDDSGRTFSPRAGGGGAGGGDEVFPPLSGINPTGGTSNCVACVNAGKSTLNGRPTTAPNSPSMIPEEVLGPRLLVNPSLDDVARHLPSSGNHGIVQVPGGRYDTHMLNVINDGGNIRYVDPQRGGAIVPSPSEIYGFWPG